MNIPAMKALAKHIPSYPPSSLGALRNACTADKGSSVLGVMCDIYKRATKEGSWLEEAHRTRFILDGEPWTIEVPPKVLKWYGLTQDQSNKLWLLQAEGYSFEQIGKAIEKMIERERG